MNESAVSIDVHEIMRCIPHRYPFLLVDRITELEPSARIKAIKNVTINELFFIGHFEHYPVMPGVLIVEACAQAAAILTIKSYGKLKDNELCLLVGIGHARFRRQVVPGDQLVLEVEHIAAKLGIGKYKARALVDNQLACEAEIMCGKRGG